MRAGYFKVLIAGATLLVSGVVYGECNRNPTYDYKHTAELSSSAYNSSANTITFNVAVTYTGRSNIGTTSCNTPGGSAGSFELYVNVDGRQGSTTVSGGTSSNVSVVVPGITASRVTISKDAPSSSTLSSRTSMPTVTYNDPFVSGMNTPPTVSDRSFSVLEDNAGSLGLSAFDADSGDSYSFRMVSGPAAGTASISGSSLQYTPPSNWNGRTTLSYLAIDSKGASSNTSTVTITVTPVNDTPSVSNASMAINEDAVGTLTLGVSDVDLQYEGDSHTWSIVTVPNSAHGTASISGNKLSFTPKPNWNGTTTLTYRARDSKGANSNTATVTITVRPVNDAPVASNTTLTVAEDTAGTVTLVASDVDGDSLTYSIVAQPNAAHGTVTISGNKATFTPKPNWNGTTTFTYRANDGTVNSNTATVTVTVTPVNDTPSVSNATLTIDEDTVGTLMLGVTDVDLSFEGDSHTWSIVTTPNAAHGTASISGNKLTFTPKPNWNGTTTLTYQVRDSKGANSNTATVTITVRPINDKAVIQNVSHSIREDTSITIPLMLEDVDLQFEGDSHTFEILDSLPSEQGRYTLTGTALEVVPTKDWNGKISLRYLARDSHGLASDHKLIEVEVTYVNDAPTATGAEIPAREGMASDHVDPWVHDVDLPYGDEHTFEIVEQPANGSAKIVHGRLEYTPSPQYFGPDSFIIRATDKEGVSIDGEVTVVVDKFNYAATDIVPGRVKMYAGIGGTAQLSAIDPNTWGSHTFEVVKQPAHGTVTVERDIITLRTDESTDTSVLIRTTDQDGLTFEKNIALEFVSAWEMFAGRDVVSSGATPSIPAVREQLMHRDGRYALQLTTAEVVSQLGSDLIAIVTPSSSVGLILEHRELAPEVGMRLTPTKLTGEYLEARLGALNPGTDSTVQLMLSRADMSGPVYAVPVKTWTPQGNLTADRWRIMQGLDKSKIQFSPDESQCVIQTNEQMVKSKNVLQEPTCLIEWETTPEEWRNTSYSAVLSMEAVGRSLGNQPVKATAYIFDSNGGKHWIADFEHDLEVVEVGNSVVYGLQPAPEEVYQSVQDLSLVLRQKEGQQCEPTTNLSAAQNAAKNWQSRTLCYVRWTALPEGLEQSKSWYTPQVVGYANVLGEQSISWKVSVFTPSGAELDITMADHPVNVIAPPPITIEWPEQNRIGEDIYSVSQLGGYVGSVMLNALAADIDLTITRGGTEVEDSKVPSFGRTQRVTRYIEGDEQPLWSTTPFIVNARYAKLPILETNEEVELLSVPHEKILPVILNDERTMLDTASLPVQAQILDTRYPADGYRASSMGDWDIRLLMASPGSSYEAITDWEPIDEDGKSSFELDLAMMTNKTVRIIAEARVRSPVPGYESIRQTKQPMALTVLNGEAIDGMIQGLRVIGRAPLRSTLYAMATDRTETSDIGNVRWEWSLDNGATWETIENTGKLPQRLSMAFQKGNYLVRAELTNRHSGAKSMTPQIEVIAFDIPNARLKGPGNVFIGDSGRFVVTDLKGETLNTEGMVVEWSEDRGKTWLTGTGEYSLTRDIGERVYLMARVKFADSPDYDQVYKKLRAGVAFRNLRPPRVQIIGPRRPEVGREATWKANLMMPYSKMDLTMDGYFILPNGEKVDAHEVAYTPTMEDFEKEKSYIGFEAWINGYEDKGGKGLTQHRLVFWSYDWPEWAINAKTSAWFSPADLTLETRRLGLFREFEGLVMEWDIPAEPGITVIKDTSQASRSLEITEPGTYTFGVHVSDDRGNYSYAETELTFAEPHPYVVTLSWSGDNDANRAPLGVLIRPSIKGGHPRDRIEQRVYSINGETLEESGTYGRATLDEGTHRVSLDIASQMGYAARGEVTIDVEKNKPPICGIEVIEGRTSWIARSNCTDEDGRIARHIWFIDGEEQSLKSSSITVPMWRYPNGEPIITLVGVDDSGAESKPVSNY